MNLSISLVRQTTFRLRAAREGKRVNGESLVFCQCFVRLRWPSGFKGYMFTKVTKIEQELQLVKDL